MQELSRLAVNLALTAQGKAQGTVPWPEAGPNSHRMHRAPARAALTSAGDWLLLHSSPGQSLRGSFKTPPCAADGTFRNPGTAAQAGRAKGGGYKFGTSPMRRYRHPPKLSSHSLTGLTDQPLEKYCLLEKESLHTFFKFFIFLSTSGSPVVTAGTVFCRAFCGVFTWAGPCCASALASCRHTNTI